MTVDYSKIDFTKCKLPPSERFRDWRARLLAHELQIVRDVNFSSVVIADRDGTSKGWAVPGRRTAQEHMEIVEAIATVDAFIVAETARIEAEEEKANWVQVPWQDVEFLFDAKCSIKWYSDERKNGERLCMRPKSDLVHKYVCRADRRTFPAGYDPTMPRWVEVERCDLQRLIASGCKHSYRTSGVFIDAHTLPPGVPLHVEPKPEPRPCTKEFAFKYPNESEYSLVEHFAHGSVNLQWRPVDTRLSYDARHPDYYEFRTTAKEDVITKPKTMTCIEFARLLIDSNQEKYILVNGKCYGYRFNREHCRIETGIATEHGTVDWGPSFGFGAASDVITVTE